MGRGGRPRDSVFARRWDADEHDQEADGGLALLGCVAHVLIS